MKKETFLKLIHTITSVDKSQDSLFKLGIDVVDYPLFNEIIDVIYSIIKDVYGTEGLDWIEWWVYEKTNNPDLQAFTANENAEIRTIDDLYNYLEQNYIHKSY